MTARIATQMDRPELVHAVKANEVWKVALKETLDAGVPATVARGTKLVEVRPDGQVVLIGKVARRRRVKRPLQGKVKWAPRKSHD